MRVNQIVLELQCSKPDTYDFIYDLLELLQKPDLNYFLFKHNLQIYKILDNETTKLLKIKIKQILQILIKESQKLSFKLTDDMFQYCNLLLACYYYWIDQIWMKQIGKAIKVSLPVSLDLSKLFDLIHGDRRIRLANQTQIWLNLLFEILLTNRYLDCYTENLIDESAFFKHEKFNEIPINELQQYLSQQFVSCDAHQLIRKEDQ